jgi:hypothetical protein
VKKLELVDLLGFLFHFFVQTISLSFHFSSELAIATVQHLLGQVIVVPLNNICLDFISKFVELEIVSQSKFVF